jgi:histidinol-phosphate/aromatic aminotransferase/cobyric acid decarboxylase-like protein|tara:strand:+ start:387 stop:1295 length:909 start_codon:yes stop_codon:yes gene_type:complete
MASIKPLTKNLREKPYGGAWAIDDPAVILATQIFLDQNAYYDIINTTNVNEYLDNYFQFVKSSRNKLIGLNKFKSLAFSLGTTQSFDIFTMTHHSRRLISFQGDYVYHNIMQRTMYGHTNKLSHPDEIQKNDCLIISCPFSDTGSEHPHMEEILTRCDKLKVPVLLDLAYINVAQNISVDLRHDCIDSVTTSLSKVFPLGYVRVGMRMQKQKIDDPIDMINSVDYVNKLGIGIANNLLTQFDANFISNKYKNKQTAMCNQLDVTPSKCVIFGIDHKEKYPEYNRGFETNRLCFSKHFETGVA